MVLDTIQEARLPPAYFLPSNFKMKKKFIWNYVPATWHATNNPVHKHKEAHIGEK